MYFTRALASVAAFATAVTAATNSVVFWSLDSTPRTIYFTPNDGQPSIDSVSIDGMGIQYVEFPESWVGNFHAVPEGQTIDNGMLGEVQFQGWDGYTYYDVSAIVNPDDVNNIKQLAPLSDVSKFSGCHTFPCSNAYYQSDALQTKTTTETMLLCTIGDGLTGLEVLDA